MMTYCSPSLLCWSFHFLFLNFHTWFLSLSNFSSHCALDLVQMRLFVRWEKKNDCVFAHSALSLCWSSWLVTSHSFNMLNSTVFILFSSFSYLWIGSDVGSAFANTKLQDLWIILPPACYMLFCKSCCTTNEKTIKTNSILWFYNQHTEMKLLFISEKCT